MPILVRCPKGCKVRAPESKAGKIVRCPKCKSLIQLAPLSEVQIANKEVEVSASLYREPTTGSANRLASNRNETEDLPSVLDVSGTESLPATIEIPEFETPHKKRPDVAGLKDRTRSANEDRVLLSRVYAGLICLVGIINLLPFLVSWFQAVQTDDLFDLQRWMYLQVFLAGLHFVYAIFLLQVSDWSALRVIAVAMLSIAMLFAVIATGLLLGGNQGAIAGFLGLQGDLLRRGVYWCVALLVMTTLFSYMAGREAANWKRSELLLREILASRSQNLA